MAKKQTQAEVAYQRGNPIAHCGVCVHYMGYNRCTKVMGEISPYGISHLFRPEANPFGKTLAPQEITAIKAMAADASDRSGG
jgi:hypothetical protein